MGASLPGWAGTRGIGIPDVRRDKAALAEACNSRCGACIARTGGGFVGGIGGTGSRIAHAGEQISSHGNTNLGRRFAICDEA
jgi:hypothetical protein